MSDSLEGRYLTEGPHGWPVEMRVAQLDSPDVIGWRDCDRCKRWHAADYGVTARFGKSRDRADGYGESDRREMNLCRACLEKELARECCVSEPELPVSMGPHDVFHEYAPSGWTTLPFGVRVF